MMRSSGIIAVLALLLAGCTTGTQAPVAESVATAGQSGTAASAQAQEDPASPAGEQEDRTALPLVVVLDASGSMKHDDAGAGVTRIEAARQAVTDVFAALPAAGLRRQEHL